MRPVSNKLANLGILAVAIFVGGAVLAASPFETPSIEWHPDIHKAHDISVRDNKPMLLVFGAEWCGYCKKMERTTLANPQMVKFINSTFVPVHVDVDKERRVAEVLDVESLPCTIVLSPNADLLGRIEGFETPSTLYRKLSAAQKLQSRFSQTASGPHRSP